MTGRGLGVVLLFVLVRLAGAACTTLPAGCGVADNDGDGCPDLCDVCPADPDADQADADGDGVGDACDLCPGLDDHPTGMVHRAKLSALLPPAGDDRLDLLDVRDLEGAIIHPESEAVELRLADHDGEILRLSLDPAVAGPYWSRRGGGLRESWRWRPPRPVSASGIKALKLTRKGDLFAFKAKARALDLSAANADHLGVTLRVGDDCWTAFAPICSPLGGGKNLVCRR